MIKLKDILNEVTQLYKVDAYIIVDNEYNVTDILNNMRAIRKITTINNNTSDDLENKNKERTDNKSIHTLSIKFMSNNPKKDLGFLKKTMMRSKEGDPDARIPGLLFIKFKPETLSKTS
jgi:Asp-tRNA(Asn)/Glu-tRNA(Gln) amidotransferase C subunit